MAKTGSAVATFGLNVSGFATGAKFIINTQRQIVKGFSSIISTAAGVASGLGIARLASTLAGSLSDVVDMAREFDNIKAASGVIASDLQAIRFSSNQRVSMQTAKDLLGNSGQVWDRYAGAIRDASVRWAAASERARAAWAAIIGELSPVFSKILDDFAKFDLVGTAVRFANIIGDGAKMVYQLLSDGELFSTIGTHFKAIIAGAIDGLAELGKAGAQIVELLWNSGFSNALRTMWQGWVGFSDSAAEYLRSAMFSTATDVKEMLNDALALGNTFASNLGLGNRTSTAAAIAKREADIAAQRKIGQQYAPKDFSVTTDFGKQLKGIIDDIGKHGFDTKPFDALTGTLSKALDKFNASTVNNPKFDIENRSIGQSYAASSQAGVGGGGPVGSTSVQTMADSLRRQTTIQERMDQKLGRLIEIQGEKFRYASPVDSIAGVSITNFA